MFFTIPSSTNDLLNLDGHDLRLNEMNLTLIVMITNERNELPDRIMNDRNEC